MHVGIVGGGAVGLTVAGDLAERGSAVTLYERDRLGSGASGRAAGICYDAFADPTDAAVATRALERYREWGLLSPCPYVWVAREAQDARAVREQVAEMRALGLDVEEITPEALGERYPAVETGGLAACAVANDAGTVAPDAVVDHLADRARAVGATVYTGTPVSLADPTTVAMPDGRETTFDAVVVAAGPATKPLLAALDIPLALETYRAQVLVTEPVAAALPSLYDASREFYWRPRDGGILVGDGAHAVDPAEWDPAADPEFVQSTRERFRGATALDPAVGRSWAGLCTATPDRDPLVGQVADGCWVATGWQGHGLMRAPALGEYLAEQLRGTTSTIDAPLAEQFDPTRFDGDERFHPLGDPTADW
ncbi:FAD-binding oxidoreductase [Halomicroarcula sp. F28]|uniref:NAD(P)/FAD-dependent oxidoreductase n=1 Tax=Haloarcula salinisoli TaxID=2487746 RepID=UPI001C7355F3|nr:FAD-dependent oxidoreductase [Halomicroarcula salinisoli]MBX0286111.1 FAD-binding oxidoreductase [Halomicroarcula salinisoli]